VEPFIWNYLVENNKDGDDDNNDNDSSDDDDEKNNVKDGDVACLSSKKRKYCPVVVSPTTNKFCCGNVSMDKQYPYLLQALGGEDGFNPTNPSVKRSMCGLMTELNKLLSTEYLLDINGISNNKISYVRVPRTQSDRSFLNSKEWVNTAIQIAESKRGGTYESAKRIPNHIIRYYRDSFLAACETQQVPVSKSMSATQLQAMLRAGGVSGTGKRELKKHLSAHLGKGFCPTRRSVNMLSEGHCPKVWISLQHGIFTWN
jgi:hypothetical protein